MTWEIRVGDVLDELRKMPDESVHCVVTSPPYWGLRDYGENGQIGLEPTPEEYVERMVEVFREVRRVLRDDGTLWLNLGDSYASQGGPEPAQTKWQVDGASATQNAGRSRTPGDPKPKDLVGIPWRVAFALQADGWYLRSDIIWSKPNPMPSSVRDRPTTAHEYIFLLTKSARYYYDADAIAERAIGGDAGNGFDRPHRISVGGRGDPTPWKADGSGTRNRRTVWTITTKPYPGAHFATFPPELPETCIKAGCHEGGTVLDPFSGAGTTGVVALRLGRSYSGIELNPEYAEMSRRRIMAASKALPDDGWTPTHDDLPLFRGT